jgi:hypothetical protein
VRGYGCAGGEDGYRRICGSVPSVVCSSFELLTEKMPTGHFLPPERTDAALSSPNSSIKNPDTRRGVQISSTSLRDASEI